MTFLYLKGNKPVKHEKAGSSLENIRELCENWKKKFQIILVNYLKWLAIFIA